MNDKIFLYIRILFILALVFLPFNEIHMAFRPRLVAGMMAAELSVYPVIGIALLTVYYRIHFKTKLYKERCFLYFSLFSMVVIILTSLWARYVVYVNGYIGVVGPITGETADFVIAKNMLAAVVRYVWSFGIAYCIFCWYKERKDKLVKDVIIGITSVSIILISFSIVEMCHFMNQRWASNMMATLTPLFYEVNRIHGNTWPPLFWEYQFRSVMPEPSNLGMIICLLIPLIWRQIGVGKKAYYGILFGVTTLLFLSQARTATITLGIEIAVFFIITLVLSMKKRRLHRFGKLLIKVICVTLLSFYSAVSFISTYMQPPAENFSKIKDGYSYVSNNITSVVSDKEKRSSNISRLENMKAEFLIFKDYPILGVGSGFVAVYKPMYIPITNRNGELERWSVEQESVGFSKSAFPVACEYTVVLAERGMLGFIVFTIPLILIFVELIKKIYIREPKDFFSIACLLSYIGFMVVGLTASLYVTYGFWLLLAVVAVCAVNSE